MENQSHTPPASPRRAHFAASSILSPLLDISNQANAHASTSQQPYKTPFSIFSSHSSSSSEPASPPAPICFDSEDLAYASHSEAPTSPSPAELEADERKKDASCQDDCMDVDEEQMLFDSLEERVFKRRRVMADASAKRLPPLQTRPVPSIPTARKIASSFSTPGLQLSAHALLERRRLGAFHAGPAQVSHRPRLLDYVSHNEQNVYRCASNHPQRNFAPPFALAYSKAAKAGGKQVIAVADEEGRVNFLDGDRDADYDAARSRKTFQAHNNAIFDVAWSPDDHTLATASGDQTVKLWDSETQQCVGLMSGHTCTIKNVAFDPSNSSILATASRDGAIRVWDRRVKCTDSSSDSPSGVATVNLLKNAHGAKVVKKQQGRSAVKSVTSVAFMQHDSHLLASSGSADSLVKVWDLRKSHSKRANPAHVEAVDARGNTSGVRPHGIVSMVLSPNGQRLYALSTDSKLTALDARTLQPLKTYDHASMNTGSFYVRTAVSSCSRYVACGSSDAGLYLFDTEGSGNDGVRLEGHEKETSGLDWGPEGRLASCSDDGIVRTWQERERDARLARADRETRWRWSGADV